MDIPKVYSPRNVESKWYSFWNENGFFHSEPNEKKPFTIVIPPPNVTGVLHMGHVLNNTIQDVLIRRARMKARLPDGQGFNACWVPGTDHASIATEAKMVAMLKEKGIDKKEIGREEYLKRCWEWKEKSEGTIIQQLKKLGCSCDWKRTRFTMEKDLSDAVTEIFCRLYEKGLIYRGVRMINWDPQAKTAVSDEEVEYKETNGKLYYVKYKIENANEFITVATTRPETILGDTAIAFNPKDKRYKKFFGKRAFVPLINRPVPIIEDEYIDPEFGTGCLKVTPAHDINDYNIGIKHKLEVIDIFNDDGTLNEKAQRYIGEDRFIVRKKIVRDLESAGHIEKIEGYKHTVGHSERTDAVIEPKLSIQWFVKMKELAKPALDAVMNDKIKLYPSKFKNLYRHWMENVKDWCISRQLWWGHRIPAWYLPNGEFVVAKNIEQAVEKFKIQSRNNRDKIEEIKQDEDVLDTWFSSWLWPISVFDPAFFQNKKPNEDLKYYYPTSILVTAPEILFFWVARMIMAGYEFMGEKPFENIYLHGIVRDSKGKKMSKSLGNSPEPMELIEKYSADGVRVGMLLCSPAGNDLLFDEALCEQGRNFANKIWNAFRLIKGWETKIVETRDKEQGTGGEIAIEWMENKFYSELEKIEDDFEKFRISDALMKIYKLVWDDFCSWYLEMIKPAPEQNITKETYCKTIEIFENLLKVLHPFMPFITEEIWGLIKKRHGKEYIIISKWPSTKKYNKYILDKMFVTFSVIDTTNNNRHIMMIPQKEVLKLRIKKENYVKEQQYFNFIKKLAGIEIMFDTKSQSKYSLNFTTYGFEFIVDLPDSINSEEKQKRIRIELKHNKEFLKSIDIKLSNEKFIANAKPEVIEREKKKKTDAEAKIKALEESLQNLK